MSIEEIFRLYGDMLFRIALVMMKNTQDAEDIVSDTMLKYMMNKKEFRDEQHRKAWLIRVTVNACKNRLMFHRRHQHISLEQAVVACQNEPRMWQQEETDTLELLLTLPARYREVAMLYYVEGYKIREIAKMLKLTEGTVKKRLERARNHLKMTLLEEEQG